MSLDQLGWVRVTWYSCRAESYGVPDDLDEDDLMDELDMLEADMAEDEALGLGGTEPDYLSVKPLQVPESGPPQQQGELDEFGLPVIQQPAQPMAQ